MGYIDAPNVIKGRNLMTESNFFNPVHPQNASRVLKYLADSTALDISLLREPPMPTKGGVENRNYHISVTANKINYDFILRCSPEKIPEWRREYGLYDLHREYRILQELRLLSIGLVTPRVYGYDSGGIFGVPCFVMEHLPGKYLTFHFDPSYDESLIHEMAHAVAEVSNIAYESNAWLKTNLPRWTMDKVLAWFERESHRFRDDPLVLYALSWLRDHLPASRKLVMCHGDPNPSNFLVKDNHIYAVVDWEFACLKDDPLDDLLCVGWLLDRKDWNPAADLLTTKRLRNLFCQAQDRDVEELKWFEVRGWFGGTYVNYNQALFQTHRKGLAQAVGYQGK
jgi:aminoglycoside phosphotransferase (APT) family kinase protein